MQRQWLVMAQLAVIVPLILFRGRRVHELFVPALFVLFCVHHLNEPLFA
jgi:hypothetical protein